MRRRGYVLLKMLNVNNHNHQYTQSPRGRQIFFKKCIVTYSPLINVKNLLDVWLM